MLDPVVELESGLVRGVVEKHEDGFNYYAFKGIPFAEPPVGELRFQDPVPIKKWSGTLDCKKFAPLCPQHNFFSKTTSYSEDCLYLNVCTHTINEPNVNTPVMVLIHGGAFIFGGADDMFIGTDYLIRKNLVLVVIQFRLGVLGFLDLEDEVASGNQGLKDQIMALQWIQQNIRVFGGDPNNVTLLGISAGGAAAHYLALSPLGKGLFHKIICHSSVVHNSWVSMSNPKENAINLCSLLGKELTDSKEIVAFLKTIDSKTLLEAQNNLRKTAENLNFAPGIDTKSTTPVMPIHRDDAATQGVHLPCLVGHNEREGIMLLYGVSQAEFMKICDANFHLMFRHHLRDILKRYELNDKQVRRLYYKSEEVSTKNVDKFVDFTTDLYFIEGIHKFLRVQVEKSSAPTYFYVFSYDTSDSFNKNFFDAPNGAGHYDETPYLFNIRAVELIGAKRLVKGTRRYKMMEQMTEMWATFAKYGRPTVETSELTPVLWKPVNDGTALRYLNIDEDMTMQLAVNIDQKLLSAKSIKA